jgi:hypothetical protein
MMVGSLISIILGIALILTVVHEGSDIKSRLAGLNQLYLSNPMRSEPENL